MVKGLRVEAVLEARFGLDGGAMFGIVPKPLWSRTNQADAANRIELGTRCMLIHHPDAGRILIDAGIGHKWDEKGRKIYKIRHQDDLHDQAALGLEAGLQRCGLSLGDIDHVIMTHLHFDHAGGLTRWADKPGGEVVPTFPNTPHYVLRKHWSWANAPSERDRGSFHPEDFSFLENPDNAPLHLVEGHSEIFPGITLIPRDGHTTHMACVKVEAEDDTWLYLADLIPTVGHLKIPYVMGYDLRPMTTCDEKREILDEAARHNWKLFFEHDPHTAWCRVEADKRGNWRQIPQDDTEKK